MISAIETTVYYSTRHRKYISKASAIKAEARAIIFKRYPAEPFESDTGHSYHIDLDEPERYHKMHRRLCRIIRKAFEDKEV
jgi:hypothetical protein